MDVPSLLEVDRALCRGSFYDFVKEFWSVVSPERPVWNWHIKYICDELQYLNSFVKARKAKPYDLVINIPPGSTKSTLVTQMYNAWVWASDGGQRFISASYSHALSLSHSVKTKDIVSSDRYRELFPELVLKADQQGKSDFRNTLGGQRFTTSTGGSVTGMHAHQILIDDPINPMQSLSEIKRLTANNFVTTTLSSRKIDLNITPTILVMQRLHEEDVTGVLLGRGGNIRHICFPAELVEGVQVLPIEARENYVDGLLDPLRLNAKILGEARNNLGGYGYAGQYLQNPVPLDGGIFKRSWFEVVDWDARYDGLRWNFVADTAYTNKETSDPSGYIAYAKYENDYIIRSVKTEHLEFPELCRSLERFVMENGYSRGSIIEIEPKASGKSLVQVLRRTTSLNVKEGRVPTSDKVARANGVSPMVESGRVKLVRGAWNSRFLDEVCMFPMSW